MIGLIAPLIAGLILKEPVLTLAIIPYVLRIKWKNLSLVAFYAYILTVILTMPRVSIYEWDGLRAGILVSTATFLLLDEILGGINLNRDRLILTGILLASSVNDYTLIPTIIGAMIYVSYSRFGKTVYYLITWLISSVTILYILRGKLSDPVMQAFTIIGLGIAFLLLAERNDVEFTEVSLFEKE